MAQMFFHTFVAFQQVRRGDLKQSGYVSVYLVFQHEFEILMIG